MDGVTHIPRQIESGYGHAAEKLLPRAYDELGKLAATKMTPDNLGQTLQATALVQVLSPCRFSRVGAPP